jgi:Holliday junction resolvase RusA-like endonuclease
MDKKKLIVKKFKEFDIQNLEENKWFDTILETISEKDINSAYELYKKFSEKTKWETISLNILLEENPQAASRPRSTIMLKNGKPRVVVYDPQKDKDFKLLLKREIKKILPKNWNICEGEVYLYVKVFKKYLKNFTKKEKILAELGIIQPLKKPDVDNYSKIIQDAFNSLFYIDDGQITKLYLEKYYSCTPRIEITFYYRINKLSSKQ